MNSGHRSSFLRLTRLVVRSLFRLVEYARCAETAWGKRIKRCFSLLHLSILLALALGRSLVDPRLHGRSSHLGSELEAYVVSYRDTRDKGGKVVYQLLILGLGVTLPYMEAGITMELGERVIVKVRDNGS